ARRVGGPAAPDAGQDVDGVAGGDPLDVDDVQPVQDGEVDVLVRRLVQVLQERHGGLAQREAPGRERGDLEEPQADPVQAAVVAFQRSPVRQLPDQPVGGGQRQAGAAGDLGDVQRGALGGERLKDVQ